MTAALSGQGDVTLLWHNWHGHLASPGSSIQCSNCAIWYYPALGLSYICYHTTKQNTFSLYYTPAKHIVKGISRNLTKDETFIGAMSILISEQLVWESYRQCHNLLLHRVWRHASGSRLGQGSDERERVTWGQQGMPRGRGLLWRVVTRGMITM